MIREIQQQKTIGEPLALRLLSSINMSPRRWQNLAKYLFDISKIIIATAVVGRLVSEEVVKISTIAFGSIAGVLFLITGILIDEKGDGDESC